jgi:hypothetical protein
MHSVRIGRFESFAAQARPERYLLSAKHGLEATHSREWRKGIGARTDRVAEI